MTDVVFVTVVVAFFAIAVAYVKGCERIVGADDVVRISDDSSTDGTDDAANELQESRHER